MYMHVVYGVFVVTGNFALEGTQAIIDLDKLDPVMLGGIIGGAFVVCWILAFYIYCDKDTVQGCGRDCMRRFRQRQQNKRS